MKSGSRYGVIGAGAVGGLYGAKLAHAGQDVHFLLHSDYEHVKEHGLRVDSPQGPIVLPEVNAWKNPKDMPACDTVLIALKSPANHILPGILPKVLKSDGFAVVLENGLGVEDFVAGIVGPERVMGGLCFLCSSKVGPGHINHMDYGRVNFADYKADGSPAGVTDRMKRIGADFEHAGVEVHFSSDLLNARWRKLVWNIPFSGLSVLYKADTAALMSNDETRGIARAMMHEVQAAAERCARPIEDAFIERMLADTAKMKPYLPSMRLDYEQGRPMEIDTIYGCLLRKAAERGVEMPITASVYHQLCFMDAHRSGPP